MSIDLSKLSAKELFELAMRKEQEEQQQAQRQEKLIELQKQRALLISSHDVALAEIERKLSELTSQRSKLIVDHEKSMSAIGREIADLMQQLQQQSEAKAPAAAKAPSPAPAAAPRQAEAPAPKAPAAAAPPVPPPAAPKPPVQEAPLVLDDEPAEESSVAADSSLIDTKEELFEKVREMMKTRSFISHSLLKEQLKVKGYNVPNLSKLVDQLIREGKLASAGGGNYALGKKA